MKAYRSWKYKTSKEIPDAVKCRGYNSSDMIVWSHRHDHHAVKCEVRHCEIHEEYVPQKLHKCSLKSNHEISYDSINQSLYKKIWELDRNLCRQDI